MNTYKLYRYIGRNGVITSPILLDDIKHIPLMELRAEPGHYLTDGLNKRYSIVVHVDEVEQWHEVKGIIE